MTKQKLLYGCITQAQQSIINPQTILLCGFILLSSCNFFLSKKKKTIKEQKQLTYIDSSLTLQLKNGVDFFATGTVPENWTLTMDFDKSFNFKSASGVSFQCPPISDYKDSIEKYIVFKASTKNQPFNIVLSNHWNQKKSTVIVQIDRITYNGTGESIYDFRLHNTWTLEKLDNEILSKSMFKNGFPTLTFNLFSQKMKGFDGCNGLGSDIKILGNRIQFSPIFSTLKACEGIATEKLKTNLLNNQLVEYYFKDDRLILYLINDSRLTFKKKY